MVGLMVQRLHKLSPIFSCLFVRYSGDLIFYNISVGTGSVLSRCRPEGMCCDAALRMMARTIFSTFWQLVGIRLLLSLSSISILYWSQIALFRLMLERCCIGLIVTSNLSNLNTTRSGEN